MWMCTWWFWGRASPESNLVRKRVLFALTVELGSHTIFVGGDDFQRDILQLGGHYLSSNPGAYYGNTGRPLSGSRPLTLSSRRRHGADSSAAELLATRCGCLWPRLASNDRRVFLLWFPGVMLHLLTFTLVCTIH